MLTFVPMIQSFGGNSLRTNPVFRNFRSFHGPDTWTDKTNDADKNIYILCIYYFLTPGVTFLIQTLVISSPWYLLKCSLLQFHRSTIVYKALNFLVHQSCRHHIIQGTWMNLPQQKLAPLCQSVSSIFLFFLPSLVCCSIGLSSEREEPGIRNHCLQ